MRIWVQTLTAKCSQLGGISLTNSGWGVLPRQQRTVAKATSTWAVATLYVILLQSPESAQLSTAYRPHGRWLQRSTMPATGGIGVGLAYLWQRWQAFVNLLRALTTHHCSFMVYAPTQLQLLAEALSWQSWSGSPLQWRLAQTALIRPTHVRDIHALRGASCVLVVGALPSPTLKQALKRAAVPTLGAAGTPLGARFLWATPGVSLEYPDVQVTLLLLVWTLLCQAGRR